jgi:hypothetical protein
VPPVYNRRTSKGCLGVALRATRGTAIISLISIIKVDLGSYLITLIYLRKLLNYINVLIEFK